MIDVLVINPGNRKKTFQNLGEKYAAIETPYWVVAIASYLRINNFSVAIIDQDVEALSAKEVALKVKEIHPKLVAIVAHGSTPQSSTLNMFYVNELANEIKGSIDSKIAVSGIHVTAMPENTLLNKNIDFVIIGEGPIALKNLIKNLDSNKIHLKNSPGLCFYDDDGTIIKNEAAPLIQNLDQTLHTAAWDLIPMKEYRSHFWHSFHDLNNTKPYAAIYTALGCQYNCSFCQINTLFGKPGMRFRSPENVVNEIGLLVEKYNIKNLKIADELFVYDENHYMKIVNMLIERKYDLNIWCWSRVDSVKIENLDKMKKAGINWLVYGIESADFNVRREIGKPIRPNVEEIVKVTRNHGISVVANYIFGLPEDNLQTMQKNYDQAAEINAEVANFYAAQAYPGTRLYKTALKQNWELPSEWSGYSHHSYDCKPVSTKYLTAEEVLAFRDKAFHEYHTTEKYLSMIKSKFGESAVNFMNEITSIKLDRQILGGSFENYWKTNLKDKNFFSNN
jgi:anaerobic magnesium-protoporphyrin IX monomethyl ester cyclase